VAWLLWTLIAVMGALIALLFLALLRERRRTTPKPPETVYQIPQTTTAELAEKDRTIGSLTAQLAAEKAQTGKNLEALTKRAELEIAQRVALARQQLEAEFHERKGTDRAVSNLRSRAALLAKVQEHLGPLIPGFPYPLKEVRHVGEIFDFLVYDGLEAGGEISIVFLEVKTSASGRTRRVTNPREKLLRDAIAAGRVRYEVWQPPTPEELEARIEELIAADSPEAIEQPS